ncbi:MAG TPA: ATP-binding cassette domain-containing protein, partial [Aggregatilineales bacterium]|nr:ATP-binding cassette domain-containing protein [Aggregatilineales bacterium]
MANSTRPVLSVRDLAVSYRTNGGWLNAVHNFHLEVSAGQIYGLVGESGSGKTTAARGILNYVPPNARVEPGSRVELLGETLTGRSRQQMQKVWGARLGLVPQSAGEAL